MATSGTLTPAMRPTAPAHTPAGGGRVSSAASCLPWPRHPQAGHSWAPPPELGGAGGRLARASLTCAVDHAGRLDGAVFGLDSRDPPHPEVVCPHPDARHRAVLNDLRARGEAAPTATGTPGRAPTLPPPHPGGPGTPASPRAGGLHVTTREGGDRGAGSHSHTALDLENLSPHTVALFHKVT